MSLTKIADPDLDPLGRGTDPQIRIPTKMSRIRNTARSTVPTVRYYVKCVSDLSVPYL
jgi:hypothetical protein